MGEDICNKNGPMISPDFLERYYAPQLRYGLEPLLEAGCRPVWHSDGDVRPMLDFLIDAGIQGLQGFQPECGMVLDELVERRTRDGEQLLIFGPLAVTTELPVCTPEEITEKVHHAIDVCKGKASLVMFTANTINPDVPLENIKAMYQALH
jgi:uroporphyrinogen decarboxylase